MRNLVFILLAMIIACGFFVGCSADDEEMFGSVNDTEYRLKEIKQQFLEYGKQYGVENISFDDEQLKKHLHLTKADIENEVIKMAAFLGKTDKKAARIRRNSRKKLPDDREGNGGNNGGGGIQQELFVSDTFSGMKKNDTLEISYTIAFVGSSFGYRHLEGVSASITKTHTIIDSLGTKVECNPHLDYIANISPNVSVTHFFVGFIDAPGTQVDYEISYCNCQVSCFNSEINFSDSFGGTNSGTTITRKSLY